MTHLALIYLYDTKVLKLGGIKTLFFLPWEDCRNKPESLLGCSNGEDLRYYSPELRK